MDIMIPKHSSKFAIAWFLLLMTIVDPSLSARTLSHTTPSHRHRHYRHAHQRNHQHPSITFYMPNILNVTYPTKATSPTTEMNNQHLPFSKPLGYFPPRDGILIPMPNSNPTISTQANNFPSLGISFPAARATLEELEIGTVTDIEENLFGDAYFGTTLVGKAKGMYVVSSEDGSSHMMALTTSFINNEHKELDGLRLYGMYRKDVSESHIAVIGGTGKYNGANGYATVKVLNVSSSHTMRRESEAENNYLLFNVYLG